MATLAANAPLTRLVGQHNSVPCVDADIIYEGAAVGDNGSGYGRPLSTGDKFLGHAVDKVDNAAGAAGAKNIRMLGPEHYRLEVALVGLITDVGQPVYMSDDATYIFSGGGTSYVGFITRYVSATKMEVEFCVGEFDEFGANAWREQKTDDYTADISDSGKIIYLAVKDKTITLLATVAGMEITIVFNGATGSDLELAGGDGKKLTNTYGTAKRGDFLKLIGDGSAGWAIVGMRGTWAQES